MTESARSSGLTSALAAYAAELQFVDLPDAVVHEAKRALIDHIGVAVVASGEASVDALVRVSARLVGFGSYTLMGRRETTSMPYAALTNGFAAHLFDYDDTFNPGDTTVHGGAPVWPVIFALAENQTVTGREALTAFAAGFEVACRLGRAAGDTHYEIGWHVTGTAGHVGAAAAAGRALNLTPHLLTMALGSAGTQAAGLKSVYGTDGKPLHAGKAAMDGLLSAVMAQEGITSSSDIIEGPRGILAVMSADPAPAKLLEELGSRWHLLANGYKAYPNGSLTHPAIDAVLQLRAQHGFVVADVKRVRASVNSKAATVTGKVDPRSGLEAKFSLTHAVAVALLARRPQPEHFTDSAARDPEVAAARALIDVLSDTAIGKRAAEVTVELADGTSVTCRIDDNKGTPDNPLSDDELTEKFTDNVAPRLGAEAAGVLAAACWAAEHADDFAGIVRLTRRPS
ncbi:MmgE/PrpD family protein [Mycobacterium sp. ITM-2016-00317]|uniref:MmgE/PrpD family protein n=1 Tax=Mycobacterium sp. ITM-2016-00317 TaxID=2099694 RepID=UPI00287F8A43|nr:MmgE/PrpD family protein [Mycobacterium sp. ITM-2016-00317]WNG86333.1 MmgE/PrpD family protein [Mycobacterium sp. ITM-2016-00317]